MLIKCDECGHRISDKSIACPNCGYPTHLNKALQPKPEATPAQEPTTEPEPTSTPQPAPAPAPVAETHAPEVETPQDEEPLTSVPEPEPADSKERHKLWAFAIAFTIILAAVVALYILGQEKPDTEPEEPDATEMVEDNTAEPQTVDTVAPLPEAPTAPAEAPKPARKPERDYEIFIPAPDPAPQPAAEPQEPVPAPVFNADPAEE